MKKGFPNKLLFIPIGWKNKGYVNSTYKGNDINEYVGCLKCRSKAKIGIENGVSFFYCPRCECKLVEKNN